MKKISIYKKYKLTKDIPSYACKKGFIFEWDSDERAFVTRSLPWYLTPMVTRSQMRNKLFEETK